MIQNGQKQGKTRRLPKGGWPSPQRAYDDDQSTGIEAKADPRDVRGESIMKHASLFTGIGGFDLAARWMGWRNVFQVEKNPWCQRVLTKNFPDTKRYGDIKEFDGTEYRDAVDVLSGGFPCQPVSNNNGRRKGDKDYRWLWPENVRILRTIRPRFYVGENVRGLLSWNGGILFEQVQTDLENEGYEIAPNLLPACGAGLDHERERIFIVAHRRDDVHPAKSEHRTDKSCQGESKREHTIKGEASHRKRLRTESDTRTQETRNHRREPGCEPIVGGMVHEFPRWLDRITGIGNAVAPALAYEIFKAIELTMLEGNNKKSV